MNREDHTRVLLTLSSTMKFLVQILKGKVVFECFDQKIKMNTALTALKHKGF